MANRRRFRFSRGGAQVPHHKNTAECETLEFMNPEQVTIPMQQHIGAPCIPTVKVGDLVRVGQVIGLSDAFLTAPIHASISGKVGAITQVQMPAGNTQTAITILSDGNMEKDDTISPPQVNSREDFIAAIKESGLVGLGGAGFPTFVKLNPKNLSEVNTLIINAAECEPYITSDYRECMENPEDIVGGISLVDKWLEMQEIFIGIEDNKPAAIQLLTERFAENPKVKVVPLKSRYPQGAEKVLIYEITGRVVPEGGLPADVGVMVQNVTSVAFLHRYFQTGYPLVSKRITVDGGAIAQPMNVRVPIGTSIEEVAKFAGGYKKPPKKILNGGPMMGLAHATDQFPVLKQTNALLFLAEEDLPKAAEPTPCIRCGRCVASCPMHLMPVEIETACQEKDLESLLSHKVMVCMECGTCEYSCPAKRPLVTVLRLSKQMVRAASRK